MADQKARRRVILSWSSGKDSAWSLRRLLEDERWEVIGLLTTVLERSGKVTMHGVPRELLREQAGRVNLPLLEVTIPDPCTEAQYAAAMERSVLEMQRMGAQVVAFGDLFLEELRRRREEKMAGTGLATCFPLWGSSTKDLAAEMIDGGLQATLVSVDTRALAASFLGRTFSAELLAELPPGVDPCGENGEFHTFVHGAPFFGTEIEFARGAVSKGGDCAHLDLRAALPHP